MTSVFSAATAISRMIATLEVTADFFTASNALLLISRLSVRLRLVRIDYRMMI
jgi:hypothetical protein